MQTLAHNKRSTMRTVSKRLFGVLIGVIAAAALVLALETIRREIGYWWSRGVVTPELVTAAVAIIGSIGGIFFAKNLIRPSEGGLEPKKRLWFYLLGMAIGGVGIALLLLTRK